MAPSKSRQSGNGMGRRQILRMIKSQRMANAELKANVNINLGNVGLFAGTVFPVTQQIVVGDTTSQRDGAQLNLVQMEMRFNSSFATGIYYRILIFQDTQNNGSLPVATDILTSANYSSPINALTVNTEKRYKVLYDHLVATNTNGELLQFHHKTLSTTLIKKVTYLTDTNSPSANGRNSLFAIVLTSINTVVNAYDIAFRTTYIDQ